MRKILLSLLAITYLIYPLSVSAGTFDVGITINKREVIIDVDTTIATNIVIDEVEKTTTSSYVYFENNGNVGIIVSVTDIESAFAGSPTTYLPYSTTSVSEKAWTELDETETATNIAFGISANGFGYTSILPDTDINMGYVNSVTTFGPHPSVSNGNVRVYEINAKTGFNWGDTTNLYYRITFVVEEAGSEYDEDWIDPEITVAAKYGDLEGEVPDFTYITRKDYSILIGEASTTIYFEFNHDVGLNVATDVDVYADIEITSDVKDKYVLNDLQIDFVEANDSTRVNVVGSTGDPEQDELLYGSSLYGSFSKEISTYVFDLVGTYTIKISLTVYEGETPRTINQLLVYKKV